MRGFAVMGPTKRAPTVSPTLPSPRSIVDWTGPMHGFAVPFERVLFVPVQWWFERDVKMCCRAVDCDTIQTGSDVCHVPRHSAEPDACCQRHPRLSRQAVALRERWSLPSDAVDVRERRAARDQCTLRALSNGSFAAHRFASEKARLARACEARGQASSSSSLSAVLWITLGVLALRSLPWLLDADPWLLKESRI